MSLSDKILNDIDRLEVKEREKVLNKIKEKYMISDAIKLNENYSWWDNSEDDIYNER